MARPRAGEFSCGAFQRFRHCVDFGIAIFYQQSALERGNIQCAYLHIRLINSRVYFLPIGQELFTITFKLKKHEQNNINNRSK